MGSLGETAGQGRPRAVSIFSGYCSQMNWERLNRLTVPVKGGNLVGKSTTDPNRLTREYHYERQAGKSRYFPPKRQQAAITEVKFPI